MRVGPFAFIYKGNGAITALCDFDMRRLRRTLTYLLTYLLTPCQYIDTTRKAIDGATTLPLKVFI